MKNKRSKGGYVRGRNTYVTCFFCLKRTSNYHIVEYYSRELGMKFRVYACDDCYRKLKGVIA